jgi:hypothetical protein
MGSALGRRTTFEAAHAGYSVLGHGGEADVSWWLQRKYLALLLALALFLVLGPVLRTILDLPLLYDAALTVVFVAAFATIFRLSPLRWPALVLGIPTLVGAWSGYVLTGPPRLPLVVGFHGAAVLFLMFAVGAILGMIYGKEHITADSLFGAFCGYLLLGLAFGHVYCLLETAAPGSFHADEEFVRELQQPDRRHFLLTYFSLITLTTVGYGDITPAHSAARGLAVLEAVAGQFYIAVLIAGLVGKGLTQAGADAPAPRSPSRTRED